MVKEAANNGENADQNKYELYAIIDIDTGEELHDSTNDGSRVAT